MTPRERWLQRVLHARGVRPVGHAQPAENQDDTVPAAPVIPLQPTAPAPGWPPAGARRISSAAPGRLPAPGQTIAFSGEEDEETVPEAPVDDEDRDDQEQDVEEAPAAPPVPPGAKHVKRKPRRGPKLSTDDPNLRITVFNLTAAAVGYGTPLAGILDTYLTVAEQAARGVFAIILAAAGAVGTWWVTGRPAVRGILACLPYWGVIRLAVCLGLAEIGRRLAPVPVAWLNEVGTEWGLGPNAISLLITSVGMCAAFWWAIDRHLRCFHWTVRWVARIPLATGAVVALNYGNPLS